jgi:hypothetical protein
MTQSEVSARHRLVQASFCCLTVVVYLDTPYLSGESPLKTTEHIRLARNE